MITPINRTLARAMEVLLQCLMALLVCVVSWQVASRYLLGSPSSWTEELARFLLIWIGILGAAFAVHTRKHIGLDLLSQSLDGARRASLGVFIDVACAAFAALAMVGGGLRLVQLTLELNQISPALGIPIGWVYSVIPLSGIIIVCVCLERILETVSGKGES